MLNVIYTRLFMATLFLIAEDWKQHKYPLTGQTDYGTSYKRIKWGCEKDWGHTLCTDRKISSRCTKWGGCCKLNSAYLVFIFKMGDVHLYQYVLDCNEETGSIREKPHSCVGWGRLGRWTRGGGRLFTLYLFILLHFQITWAYYLFNKN